MAHFIDDCRNELMLIAGSLDTLLPADSVARTIWNALEELDFSAFEARYNNDTGGRPAVGPRRLAGVWIVAMLRGISSSVRLAALCGQDVELRWMLGDAPVQKSTLCDFRKNHVEHLADLSTQVLAAMARADLLPAARVAVDGTIIRAAASCRANGTRKQLKGKLQRLKDKVETTLRQADSTSAVDELEQRRERLEQALEQMEALGLTNDQDKLTVTEPDAPMRKLKNGAFAPAHNIQVSADLDSGAIIEAQAIDQGNDAGQLVVQLDAAQAHLDKVADQLDDDTHAPGPIGAAAADSAYHDTLHLKELEERGIEAFVPDDRSNRKTPNVSDAFQAQAFTYDANNDTMICPQGSTMKRRKMNNGKTAVTYQARAADCQRCPHKQDCCPKSQGGRSVNRPLYPEVLERTARRMESQRGVWFKNARFTTVEGAIGRLVHHLHWRRCRTWGRAGAQAEALWRQITHNLMVLTRCWQPLVSKEALE